MGTPGDRPGDSLWLTLSVGWVPWPISKPWQRVGRMPSLTPLFLPCV